jgi:hypothetical protein
MVISIDNKNSTLNVQMAVDADMMQKAIIEAALKMEV